MKVCVIAMPFLKYLGGFCVLRSCKRSQGTSLIGCCVNAQGTLIKHLTVVLQMPYSPSAATRDAL